MGNVFSKVFNGNCPHGVCGQERSYDDQAHETGRLRRGRDYTATPLSVQKKSGATELLRSGTAASLMDRMGMPDNHKRPVHCGR